MGDMIEKEGRELLIAPPRRVRRVRRGRERPSTEGESSVVVGDPNPDILGIEDADAENGSNESSSIA